ncbi:MAG: 3-oxoacyl-ACP synthase [Bacteriovoracaceae bacterium]|nr:3-oxoacyl-ACP synthase [Bacteriovoracaceae bacterium]
MIGLISTGMWLPKGRETSKEISVKSNIPQDIIETKMGIIEKCRAREDEHPSMMAVEAAKRCLKGIDPKTVDAIIWTGSEHKDYPVWSAGIYVQNELELSNAWSVDMSARCSSNVVGLKFAKALIQTDKKINRVLLCGGHRTGDLVNYNDPNARFLYNLSDGGSAMLVGRNEGNPINEASIITDGDFSLDVIIPSGGTRASSSKEHNKFLTVPNVSEMREKLAKKSLNNFLKVIKESAQCSRPEPIDYLSILHMKKSIHLGILEQLELSENDSTYLDHFGHFGAPDQVLSLALAEKENKLKNGDHVVMASAGIGYTWSAISLTWKENCFRGTI